MKILVTGAAGFIGSKICHLLALRGDDVVGLDNINDYYDVRLKAGRLHELVEKEVRKTLFMIRKSGVRMAIGSSSKNTPYILDRIGLEEFFDAVSDGNNITRSKPDPEVFLKAAEMLGLQPADCLVVEDAHSGVEAAVEGGFDCAAMGDAKEDARATYHLGGFADLQRIVLPA